MKLGNLRFTSKNSHFEQQHAITTVFLRELSILCLISDIELGSLVEIFGFLSTHNYGSTVRKKYFGRPIGPRTAFLRECKLVPILETLTY